MKILLADDHVLFREGFAMMIEKLFPYCCISQCSTWTETHQSTAESTFDIALLDLFMPGHYLWNDELSTFLNAHPYLSTCIVSASHSQEHIKKSFDLGVKGYLYKTSSPQEMKCALLHLQAGKYYLPEKNKLITKTPTADKPVAELTVRQKEILLLLADGHRNRIIAEKLKISESTIKRHIYNIFKILKAKNRIEAIEVARQKGFLYL